MKLSAEELEKKFDLLKFQKSLNIFIYSIIPLIILSFSTEVLDPFIPIKVWITTFFSSSILLYFSFIIFRYKYIDLKITRVDLIVFIFLIYNFLSIFWSISSILSVLTTSTLISIITFYSLFRFSHLSSYKNYKKILILTSIPVLIYGYFQYFHMDPFFNMDDSYGINRVISTFGNKNYLAYFLGIVLFLITPYLFLEKKTKKFSILFILNLSLMILISCRGALAGIILIFPFYILRLSKLLKKRGNYKKIIINILIAIFFSFLLIIVTSKHSKPLKAELDLVRNNQNIDMRLEIFKIGILSFLDSPILGSGNNSFSQIFFHKKGELIRNNKLKSNYYIFVKNAHNEIIQIMVENGFIGLVFIILFLYFLIIFGKRFREEFFILLFLLISSLYSFPIRIWGISIIFIMIISRISRLDKKIIKIKLSSNEGRWVAYFLIIFSIFQILYGNSIMLSAFYLRKADDSLKSGNYEKYGDFLRKSLAMNRFNENSRFRLATLELKRGEYNYALYNFMNLNYRKRDPSVIYNIALTLMFMGYYRDSLYNFEKIYPLTGKKNMVLLNIGVIYEKLHNYKLATYYYYRSFYEKETLASLSNLINIVENKRGLLTLLYLVKNSNLLNIEELEDKIHKKIDIIEAKKKNSENYSFSKKIKFY